MCEGCQNHYIDCLAKQRYFSTEKALRYWRFNASITSK